MSAEAEVRRIIVKALQAAPASIDATDEEWDALADAARDVLDVEPWHAMNAALSLAWFGRSVTFSYSGGRDPELQVRLEGAAEPFTGPRALRYLIEAAEYLSSPPPETAGRSHEH